MLFCLRSYYNFNHLFIQGNYRKNYFSGYSVIIFYKFSPASNAVKKDKFESRITIIMKNLAQIRNFVT